MTWSIIARDEATGWIGIAVTTCAFGVGSRVPFIRTGVGAIATQARTNWHFGPRGLALLAAGASADDCVRMLMAADEERDHRQVHAMDREGGFAARTGAECIPWCGSLMGDTFSLAGNMLSGAQVLEATAQAMHANRDMAFALRLITALDGGEAAGGDKRGRQSAALLIHDEDQKPLLDLRVDDHSEPLAELRRLEEVARGSVARSQRVMARELPS